MRIVVSTQEPTIIPASILDLTSFIICHKFSSPAWCAHLKSHVSIGDGGSDGEQAAPAWFDEVMQLRTGQAILFSSGTLTVVDALDANEGGLMLLGTGHLLITTRPRITLDGGSSILAGQRLLAGPHSAITQLAARPPSPVAGPSSPKYDLLSPAAVPARLPAPLFPPTVRIPLRPMNRARL